MKRLYRVVAPHFVAGFEVREDRIVNAAPIIAYLIRMTPRSALQYCRRRGWQVEQPTPKKGRQCRKLH